MQLQFKIINTVSAQYLKNDTIPTMFSKKTIIVSVSLISLLIWNISLQMKSNNLTHQINDIRSTSEWAEDSVVINEGSFDSQIDNLQKQITTNESLIDMNYILLKEYVEDLYKRQSDYVYEVIKIYHP